MAKHKAKAKAPARPPREFLLTAALTAGSNLRRVVQNGMGAFEADDKLLIAVDQRPRIGDSINLDEALRAQYPQANRWDYIFSVSDAKKVVALEPHTANDSEVKTVIAKKKHAVDYLKDHLEPKHRVSAWLWVSSGKATLTKTEKYERALASAGIKYVGRFIRSLDQ